ncbi:MAG: sigma 54-interacting transcriptional regulator [Lentisphaeraceae bacterium]|nr:sigma 54-interacting transcriptional regulator [Lentisphaeraceae bacterium]
MRVLQEHEYYRVGGLKSISLKAPVIAASNRNLQELVKAGEISR